MLKGLRWKKRVALIVCTALLSTQFVWPAATETAHAADAPAQVDLKLEARSAILMDAASGQILYSSNADVAYPPASMAKMMTEYLVMENIKSGKIKWEDTITASPYAASVGGSGQLIGPGEKMSVRDVFSEMSIYSGNDGSVDLAEAVGGTEENFAKMMNEKAKALGLSDQTQFINATGLSRADIKGHEPASIPGETMMTARDAAILARAIITDHPEVLEFTKVPSKKLREKDSAPMINWNWMLEGNSGNPNFRQYAYQGLDGLKTGHTDEAGYCFTGTAVRDGMRLISVVMGTPSEPKRFMETRKLLDYGFTNFESKQVIAAKSEVDALKSVTLKKGVETSVPVVTEGDVSLVVKKGTKDEEIVKEAAAIEESKRIAPIKEGQVLGTLTVKYGDTSKTVNLVAKEDVKKGSWIRLFFRAVKNFFGDMFKGIKNLF